MTVLSPNQVREIALDSIIDERHLSTHQRERARRIANVVVRAYRLGTTPEDKGTLTSTQILDAWDAVMDAHTDQQI